jgi:hypothetical protein
MPGFYSPGDYDVAGTIVGVVDESHIVDGSKVRPGHRIVGCPPQACIPTDSPWQEGFFWRRRACPWN